jgi:hypothetical protein
MNYGIPTRVDTSSTDLDPVDGVGTLLAPKWVHIMSGLKQKVMRVVLVVGG